MKYLIPIALIMMLLSGCATSEKALSYAEAPVPIKSTKNAVLYIYRKYAQPTAFSAYLEIDGKEAVSLSQEGFTWVYIKPGNHKFKHGWPLFAAMPSVDFEREFKPGKTYAFEISGRVSGMTAETAIKPTNIEYAKQKMASCCRYVQPSSENF